MVSTVPQFANATYWQDITRFYSQMDEGEHQTISQLVRQSMNLRCDLYNATYQTDFSFLNGVQEVEVHVQDFATAPLPFVEKIQLWNGPISHAVDSVFQFASAPCDGARELVFYGPSAAHCTCAFNTTVIEAFSYQAIMAAFNRQIIGSLEKDSWPRIEEGASLFGYGSSASSTSHILETELAGTPELDFIQPRPIDLLLGDVSEGSILNELQRSPAHLQRTDQSFGDMLEQLFQNVTVGVMSSPYFQ